MLYSRKYLSTKAHHIKYRSKTSTAAVAKLIMDVNLCYT